MEEHRDERIALARCEPAENLLYHSNRGRQYAIWDSQVLLAERVIQAILIDKGNHYANVMRESFFNSFKIECVARHVYQNSPLVKQSIFEWIEVFSNRQ